MDKAKFLAIFKKIELEDTFLCEEMLDIDSSETFNLTSRCSFDNEKKQSNNLNHISKTKRVEAIKCNDWNYDIQNDPNMRVMQGLLLNKTINNYPNFNQAVELFESTKEKIEIKLDNKHSRSKRSNSARKMFSVKSKYMNKKKSIMLEEGKLEECTFIPFTNKSNLSKRNFKKFLESQQIFINKNNAKKAHFHQVHLLKKNSEPQIQINNFLLNKTKYSRKNSCQEYETEASDNARENICRIISKPKKLSECIKYVSLNLLKQKNNSKEENHKEVKKETNKKSKEKKMIYETILTDIEDCLKENNIKREKMTFSEVSIILKSLDEKYNFSKIRKLNDLNKLIWNSIVNKGQKEIDILQIKTSLIALSEITKKKMLPSIKSNNTHSNIKMKLTHQFPFKKVSLLPPELKNKKDKESTKIIKKDLMKRNKEILVNTTFSISKDDTLFSRSTRKNFPNNSISNIILRNEKISSQQSYQKNVKKLESRINDSIII